LVYLQTLIDFCKCDDSCVGYSGLSNVNDKTRSNSQASYFFGESLKYLYLTFMRNEPTNPLPFDEYIFNTEAHPFPKAWGLRLRDTLAE